ncbi:uncharacterized protein LOC132308441 [Cornus florida]|uniref:uncharacterized protein LOC132308441 n=1 Tax=Cornus florida TaxID=4283 RepID=UPI00289CB250|nr:uncharacterized protein LOC132308441 [Cornus florida]
MHMNGVTRSPPNPPTRQCSLALDKECKVNNSCETKTKMPQTQSNSPIKTRPNTISLHQQASTFPPTLEKIMYKSNIITTTIPDKMAANTPVEVGTRGTVGSLILQEMEHFSRLELDGPESSKKPQCQSKDMASTSTPKPKLGSLVTTPKKKKRGGGKLIPSMCSMVEVAESNRPNGTSGFGYKNLKADAKKLEA